MRFDDDIRAGVRQRMLLEFFHFKDKDIEAPMARYEEEVLYGNAH